MWVLCDFGGIICVLFTYAFLLGISSTVVYVSLLPLSSAGIISLAGCLVPYYLILSLTIACHLKCMLTDPGAMPRVPYRNLPTCAKCLGPKPFRVHHCSTCKRCILKMDHHCPWMNNCIGYFNQKHFMLFLAYSEIACIYSMAFLILRACYCQIDSTSELCSASNAENSVSILLGLVSMVLLGLFSLFIAVLLHDQFKCISRNTTGIENLKKELIQERSPMENFSEVFGGKIGIRWLLPLGVPGTVDLYLSRFNEV